MSPALLEIESLRSHCVGAQHPEHAECAASESSAPWSIVIPVFNGAATIDAVVDELFRCFAGRAIEVVLVNDASTDDSERVCRMLAAAYPGRVVLVQLSRNSGEQRAVLAGLRHCRGDYAAVIDDDGQHSAAETVRLFAAAQRSEFDVVFGRYVERRHAWHRRFVSRLHNAAAVVLFNKPCGLYLSSFKVVNRYVIDRLSEANGPFVHLEAMILQITNRIGQVDVTHRESHGGGSRYTFGRLCGVWFEAVLGYSVWPFRSATALGALACAVALIVILARILFPAADSNAGEWAGVQSLLLGAVLFYLGLLGECVVRQRQAGDAGSSSNVRYVFRKAMESV